jgi:hypothetical protein
LLGDRSQLMQAIVNVKVGAGTAVTIALPRFAAPA